MKRLLWCFPPYLGGTLNFPEFVGIETFLSEADRLAEVYEERFRLTDGEKELVREDVINLLYSEMQKIVKALGFAVT